MPVLSEVSFEVGPEEYEARMKIGVAAIRGTYQGRVKIVKAAGGRDIILEILGPEMVDDDKTKINRPRQMYIGATERKYEKPQAAKAAKIP